MARTDSADVTDDRMPSDDCELLPEHDLNDPPSDCLLTSPAINPSHTANASRTRHRHHRHRRHHQHHRHWRFFHFKRKESNFLAAICSMIVIVLLCTALAEPEWFYLHGGGCRDNRGNVVSHIGVSQFFYSGKFLHTSDINPRTVYVFGNKDNEVLVNCITIQIVSIMNSVISLAFFAIGLSLTSFFLDLLGPTQKLLKVIRRHGILNILTVVFCVVINGFCYWATEDLSAFQQQTRMKTGSKVEVEFSVSFFLVTAAGAVSVMAAACNLLRRHTRQHRYHGDVDHHCHGDIDNLLADMDIMDFSADVTSTTPPSCLPPPPPYTP